MDKDDAFLLYYDGKRLWDAKTGYNHSWESQFPPHTITEIKNTFATNSNPHLVVEVSMGNNVYRIERTSWKVEVVWP